MNDRDVARQILSAKEFEAWEYLTYYGWTLRRTAAFLGISHTSVRDRLENANRKLKAHSRADFPAKPTEESPTTDRPIRMVVSLLVQRDGPTCYLCRREFPASELCVEHVVPASRGGTDEAHNLALACSSCNGTKGHKYVSLRVTSGRAMYHPSESK